VKGFRNKCYEETDFLSIIAAVDGTIQIVPSGAPFIPVPSVAVCKFIDLSLQSR
jgi:hypothetical protein